MMKGPLAATRVSLVVLGAGSKWYESGNRKYTTKYSGTAKREPYFFSPVLEYFLLPAILTYHSDWLQSLKKA